MSLARSASILGLAFLLGFPLFAGVSRAAPGNAWPVLAAKGLHRKARVHHTPSPVTVKVSVGFGENVRTSAWAPVAVTLHNRSNSLFSGTVEIPDWYANNQGGPPQPFHGLYETPVTLPPGTTKQVLLYLPGNDLGNNSVNVKVRRGNTLVTSAQDWPTPFDDQQLSIGVFTNDPTSTTWLRQDNPLPEVPGVIRLSPTTLVPQAAALDSFDIIALSNANLAALDRAQRSALVGYVRDGGGLLLVGGPDWQETLHPLPSVLVPGHLSGSATVSGLGGLGALSHQRPPLGRTALSILSHPTGLVLAQQGSIPLAVQTSLGQGRIIYLAFDPSVDPVLHWKGAAGMLTDIVRRVAPAAVARGAMPSGMGPRGGPFFGKGFYGPMNIAGELANVPAAALPSIVLFVLLTVFYILLLGPANFLVLRRLHRRELAWVTVPAGALLCLAMTFGLAFHLKGNTVLVNTIGMLQLTGNGDQQPFAQYVGLFAPVRGDYTLTDTMSALPSDVPQFDYYGGPPQSGRPLGLRLQEGSKTRVDFVSMNMWSMRSVALHSTMNVAGAIRGQLHLNRTGWIVGAVHNDTHLTLIHPAIIAGTAAERLADLPPEATVRIRIKPNNDVFANIYGRPIWYKLYGSPRYGPGYYGGPPGIGLVTGQFMGGSYCCYGPAPPPEKTLADRIRNAAENIPEAQAISALGQVTLAGWTEQPFGAITVDGAAPQRRDLTLVMAPLQVRFPHGPFTLRTGVLDAQIIDQSPQAAQNLCCAQSGQSVLLSPGSWAILGFDIPQASHLHWTRLDLGVNAGGASGAEICSVYDWRHAAWVHEDVTFGYTRLKHPARFISPAGRMLVRLRATADSGNIRIMDIHRALQLRGTGVTT